MILITELLAIREDTASNEAVFHIDTPELRVIEAKTKHAVKFFTDIYFDDENYQPFKYGTKCWFVIRETAQAPYNAIRLNFDSKQFVALKDKSLTGQELRSLCESFPKLYDLFEADAKKNGVLAVVKYDDFDVESLTKTMKKFYKETVGRKGRMSTHVDMYEFKRWFENTFGKHKLSAKLQSELVEAARKSLTISALLNEEFVELFDQQHVVDLITKQYGNLALNSTIMKHLMKEPKAMKALVDHYLAYKSDNEYSRGRDFNEGVNTLVANANGLDISKFISDEQAAMIGAYTGPSRLVALNVELDDALAAKIIELNPKQLTELPEKLQTNKLKERARLAALASARRK